MAWARCWQRICWHSPRGFLRFKTARELACHAEVAPFEYSSGSSIRGKTRVSKQAQPTRNTCCTWRL
ncbi:MAG: transposase [Flavobacteriales bacterium]|nr:transposase [Flavobacteriales bacterium]